MPITPAPSLADDLRQVLPGHAVVARIRRVLTISLVAAFVYPASMAASSSYCPGGFDENGGFIDAAGKSVEAAPSCIQLSLAPSPLVYLGISLIVLFAISRVLRAVDEPAALRTLDRAAAAVAILVFLAIVVSQVWFRQIPITDFVSGSSFAVFSPFPLGSIEMSITPLTKP